MRTSSLLLLAAAHAPGADSAGMGSLGSFGFGGIGSYTSAFASGSMGHGGPGAGGMGSHSGTGSHSPGAGDHGTGGTIAVVCTATGGAFSLTRNGATTAALSFDATATEVQLALEALSTVEAGSVSVVREGPCSADGGKMFITGIAGDTYADGSMLTGAGANIAIYATTVPGAVGSHHHDGSYGSDSGSYGSVGGGSSYHDGYSGPSIKDLFHKFKTGHKGMKMSELRGASGKMKRESPSSPEDLEDAFTLLRDFAKDPDADHGGEFKEVGLMGAMSDMMDKELMRKARDDLQHRPPAKRKEFERKVSEAAKETRHAIAKFGLKGKAVGYESKHEEDGLRMLLKKKGRGEMGAADTWVQAHNSDGAAKFKLPKSFAHKLPARVTNDVGVVAWENPSPWAQEGKTVKSHVSGLSLFDDAGEPVKVHGLAAGEAIEIVFPGTHGPEARCSWWDAMTSEWKTDGVETEHRAADTLCKTTHLTEFALVEGHWSPCKDHTEGAICHACDPENPSCTETTHIKSCQVVAGFAELQCIPDAKPWSPCQGKAVGTTCHMCPTGDPTCTETTQMKSCQAMAGATELVCMPQTTDPPPYSPCKDQVVGTACHMCRPGDATCTETAEVKSCQALPGAPADVELACLAGAPFSPCQGKAEGASCRLCPPSDVGCMETKAFKVCTRGAASAADLVCTVATRDRAVENGAHLCHGGAADFRPDMVLIPRGHPDRSGADFTCMHAFKHIAERLPKPFRDMTCHDLETAAPWREPDAPDGQRPSTAISLLNGFVTPCCGGPSKTRCADNSNMCKNPNDFMATAVAVHVPADGHDGEHDITCMQIAWHLLSKLPPSLGWANTDCAGFAAASWDKEDGKGRDTVSNNMNYFGPTCCGSLAKTKCGGMGGNLCAHSGDFKPEVVVRAATGTEPALTCSAVNAHYAGKMPRPWNELTCKDIAETSWVEDGGEVKAAHVLAGVSTPCCGSPEQGRCVDTSNMCINRKDFIGDMVLHAHTGEGGSHDITCAYYGAHIGSKLPKRWDEMSCEELRAVSYADETGAPAKPFTLVGSLGPICCGSAERTRCIDSSNMCKATEDFNGALVLDGATTCQTYASFLNAHMPKRWDEMSCAELAAVSWTDDGKVTKLMDVVMRMAPRCCGSAVQARCAHTSNMCLNSADFRGDAVLFPGEAGDHTYHSCQHYASQLNMHLPRRPDGTVRQWEQLDCSELAALSWTNEEGKPEKASDWLTHMAAPCCGSFKKARCIDFLMPGMVGCVGYQTAACDGMGGLETRDFSLSDPTCSKAPERSGPASTMGNWDPINLTPVNTRFALDVCTSIGGDSAIQHSSTEPFTVYVTCKNKEGTAPLAAGTPPKLLYRSGANQCSESRSSFSEHWAFGEPGTGPLKCQLYGDGCVPPIHHGSGSDGSSGDSYGSNYGSSYSSDSWGSWSSANSHGSHWRHFCNDKNEPVFDDGCSEGCGMCKNRYADGGGRSYVHDRCKHNGSDGQYYESPFCTPEGIFMWRTFHDPACTKLREVNCAHGCMGSDCGQASVAAAAAAAVDRAWSSYGSHGSSGSYSSDSYSSYGGSASSCATVLMSGAGSDIANGKYTHITQELAEARGFMFDWKDGPTSKERITVMYSKSPPVSVLYYLECRAHNGSDCSKWIVADEHGRSLYWKHTAKGTVPPPKHDAWEIIPSMHSAQSGVAPAPFTECSSGSDGPAKLIAQLRAVLDRLSHDTEAVGRLHAKLTEVEAATAGCNHGGTGAVASVGPMEPLTCGGAAAGTGEVQFLPVSEMFKPGLAGRLADMKAKGGQMCFCK